MKKPCNGYGIAGSEVRWLLSPGCESRVRSKLTLKVPVSAVPTVQRSATDFSKVSTASCGSKNK
jgi:hypothetical protein